MKFIVTHVLPKPTILSPPLTTAYTCTDGKEYRADASCSPTCGQSAAARELCEEDPEEGCVCPRGKMRLGDKCVEENECGCVLILNDETKEFLLPVSTNLSIYLVSLLINPIEVTSLSAFFFSLG